MINLIYISSLLVASSLSSEKTQDSPNIVWLIAEDVSPDFACYGHPIIKTPNIDKLAAQGVRYENAFASGPVSSSSRSGFITGMYQTSFGADYHDTSERNKLTLPQGVETLPDILYNNEYFVDFNGKTHFNFKYEGEAIKDREWNERGEEQPFFLVLQSKYTHRPFKKDSLRPIDPKKIDLPPYYPDHDITRIDWADYLEDVQLLDDWVGEQMEWLDSNGLLKNTIVVFFGDHGRPHVRGKQFLYDEGIKVPLVITQFNDEKQKPKVINNPVSLIDLTPTMLNFVGLDIPDNMHGIDILSNINRGYIFASRSRNGDAIDKIRCIRSSDYLFIKNFMPETPWMQLSSYKKMSYPVYTLLKVLHAKNLLLEHQAYFMSDTKPEFELYDINKDPFQINNIANIKPKVVAIFKDILDDWQVKTNDYYEDPDLNDIENIISQKRKGLEKWYLSNGLSNNPSNEAVLNMWKKKLEVEMK